MRKYMEALRARGELLEVTREVNAKHELAAVTSAAHRRWGKPILFHHVTGTQLPVLTSIYGSRERLGEILGIGPDEFCRKWNALATEADSRDAVLRPAAKPVGDLVDCKVSDLPLITYSERDAAPYFTSAMFLAHEPETGVRNLSFHRSMYVSDQELRCRLAPRHHLTLYHEKSEKMGKPARGGDADRAASDCIPHGGFTAALRCRRAGGRREARRRVDRDAAVQAHRHDGARDDRDRDRRPVPAERAARRRAFRRVHGLLHARWGRMPCSKCSA